MAESEEPEIEEVDNDPSPCTCNHVWPFALMVLAFFAACYFGVAEMAKVRIAAIENERQTTSFIFNQRREDAEREFRKEKYSAGIELCKWMAERTDPKLGNRCQLPQ